MELRSILNKMGRKENPFSKLSAAEKSYARIFESTLGADVTPQQLKKAREQMNELGLSFDQEDFIKTMIMKDRNKSLKNKGGVILKTNKEKMAYGGMASGKKHMYATGGSVKDNAGLRALQKASPMAYNKIKGIV